MERITLVIVMCILLLNATSSHEIKPVVLNNSELLYYELQQVQQQVQSLTSKVVVLETKNNELQRVQQRVQSLTSKVVVLETKNNELQRVQQQVQFLTSKVVVLETKNNELQQVQQQVQNLSCKIEITNNEVQHVQQQLQSVSSKVTEQETKNNELQHVQTEVQNLSRKLETTNNETEHLKQNVQTLSGKLVERETNDSEIQNTVLTHDRGSVFVRWGRKQCPDNDTELVYSGYAGGLKYDHKGAGTTALCLTPDPIFGKYLSPTYNYLYGAEFDTDFFGPGTATGDIPCAVCRSKATSMLMIPGRNECYPGWKKQYGGYLMTGHYNFPASNDFSCVDENPEFIAGGNGDHNGRFFMAVKAVCGSLQCPPYIQGKTITCVVCTK